MALKDLYVQDPKDSGFFVKKFVGGHLKKHLFV